jgi:hypothetical protein
MLDGMAGNAAGKIINDKFPMTSFQFPAGRLKIGH